MQVQGTLVANPSQLTAPVTLCLHAHVTANILPAQGGAASPCPAGQLQVYVTAATKILRRFDGASGLDELSAGDVLQVRGSLVNGQFTAIVIEDVSIQEAFTSLIGTVLYVSPFTQPSYFTVRVLKDERHAPFRVGAVLVVYVNANTQMVSSAATTNSIKAISPGQIVTVIGVYDRHRHSFVDTFRVRIH